MLVGTHLVNDGNYTKFFREALRTFKTQIMISRFLRYVFVLNVVQQ